MNIGTLLFSLIVLVAVFLVAELIFPKKYRVVKEDRLNCKNSYKVQRKGLFGWTDVEFSISPYSETVYVAYEDAVDYVDRQMKKKTKPVIKIVYEP